MSGRDFFFAEDTGLTSGSTNGLKCSVLITQAQGNFVDDQEEWIAIGSVLLSNDGIGRGYAVLESQTYGGWNDNFQYWPKDSTDFMHNLFVGIVYPEYNFLDNLEINQGVRVGIETDS